MNFRFTLVLLAVAILVIGGFGIAQRQLPSTPTATPTPSLLSVSSLDITGIDVKTPDHETSLTKNASNQQWQLVKPVTDPNVDQSKVDGIVSQLADLPSTEQVASASSDLSQYGLNNPSVTVTLQETGNKSDTLLIGKATMDANNYYALKQGGSNVDIVSSSLVNDLTGIASTPPRATPTPVPTSAPPAASAAVTPGAS